MPVDLFISFLSSNVARNFSFPNLLSRVNGKWILLLLKQNIVISRTFKEYISKYPIPFMCVLYNFQWIFPILNWENVLLNFNRTFSCTIHSFSFGFLVHLGAFQYLVYFLFHLLLTKNLVSQKKIKKYIWKGSIDQWNIRPVVHIAEFGITRILSCLNIKNVFKRCSWRIFNGSPFTETAWVFNA